MMMPIHPKSSALKVGASAAAVTAVSVAVVIVVDAAVTVVVAVAVPWPIVVDRGPDRRHCRRRTLAEHGRGRLWS